jgi:hypothetical protein
VIRIYRPRLYDEAKTLQNHPHQPRSQLKHLLWLSSSSIHAEFRTTESHHKLPLTDSSLLTLQRSLLALALPPAGRPLVHNLEPTNSPAPSATQRNHR